MTRALYLVDSIAAAEPAMAGGVVVCGSHGGRSAAHYVLALPVQPLAVFFNDAGVGKEGAGIVGLSMLQAVGTIAAAYSHESARIGEAADGLENGIISQVNAAGAQAGLAPGQRVSEQVARLRLSEGSWRPARPEIR